MKLHKKNHADGYFFYIPTLLSNYTYEDTYEKSACSWIHQDEEEMALVTTIRILVLLVHRKIIVHYCVLSAIKWVS